MKFLQCHEIMEILTDNIEVLYDHTKPDGTFNCKLGGLSKAIDALIELEHGKQPRFTNWYVLLEQDKDGWKATCCIDALDERWEYEDLPDWELILPIPNPDDVGEWTGF